MNILVTGAWKEAKVNIKEIEKMGYYVYFLQYENDELPCLYSSIEAVICNGLFLYHSIEKFTNLKYIQLISAGYDRVPMDYVKKNKIQIFNAKGVYSVPMAEFAVMGILSLYKDLYGFYKNKNNKVWQKNNDLDELDGKNVAVLGMGSVGIEIAKRLKAFGCKIIGFDILEIKSQYFDEIYNIEKYNDYVNKMDIIVSCLPFTNDTDGFINTVNLSKLKPTSIIVNLSRGKVINQYDLIKSLESNVIRGAVLDVFDEEPLNIENELWVLDNVVLTPHNSFISNKNSIRLSNLIFDNLQIYTRRRKLND